MVKTKVNDYLIFINLARSQGYTINAVGGVVRAWKGPWLDRKLYGQFTFGDGNGGWGWIKMPVKDNPRFKKRTDINSYHVFKDEANKHGYMLEYREFDIVRCYDLKGEKVLTGEFHFVDNNSGSGWINVVTDGTTDGPYEKLAAGARDKLAGEYKSTEKVKMKIGDLEKLIEERKVLKQLLKDTNNTVGNGESENVYFKLKYKFVRDGAQAELRKIHQKLKDAGIELGGLDIAETPPGAPQPGLIPPVPKHPPNARSVQPGPGTGGAMQPGPPDGDTKPQMEGRILKPSHLCI